MLVSEKKLKMGVKWPLKPLQPCIQKLHAGFEPTKSYTAYIFCMWGQSSCWWEHKATKLVIFLNAIIAKIVIHIQVLIHVGLDLLLDAIYYQMRRATKDWNEPNCIICVVLLFLHIQNSDSEQHFLMNDNE